MSGDVAVVDTLTVTFVAELLSVTEDGETVQLACAGVPVQVTVTFPLSPPRLAMLRV